MEPMREFDLFWEFSMVLVTAACLLAISVVLVGTGLLIRRFLWRPSVAIGKAISVPHILATRSLAVSDPPREARRIVFLAPLAVFLGLAIVLAWGMTRDPGTIPSALIGKYAVEGHVSADVIKKLLTEHPAIAGISVPGMPPGTPGMTGRKTGPLPVYEIGSESAPGKAFATQ